MKSHLLSHSDCEGFYLPVEFDYPFINNENPDKIVTGGVGASYGLQRDLIEIAPVLHIQLNGDQLTDIECEHLNIQIEDKP